VRPEEAIQTDVVDAADITTVITVEVGATEDNTIDVLITEV
jgi:hypothetical protein